MEDYKLSVIIPAYNAGEFIGRCLDSILDQDIDLLDYEVIVVNDGSKDNTVEVVEKYISQYPNIRLITQENGGSSVARNNGVKNAKGKYIWFIDADDYIKSNVLRDLTSNALDNNLDLFFFELERSYESDEMKQGRELRNECIQVVRKGVVLNGKEALIDGYYPCSACSALLRTEFIRQNSLTFYPKIYHQDAEFMYRTTTLAQRIMFSELSPYYYYTRSGSVTTSVDPQKIQKRLIDDIIIAKSFEKFSHNFVDDKDVQKIIMDRSRSIVFGVAYTLYKNRKEYKKNGVLANTINYMREHSEFPLYGPFSSWKHMIFCKFILNNVLN